MHDGFRNVIRSRYLEIMHGEILQWYIDICYESGVENNSLWMDDLFLDIIVLPRGGAFQLDIDELEGALSKGIIDKDLYNMTLEETNKILELIKKGEFSILEMAKKHRDYLLKELNICNVFN